MANGESFTINEWCALRKISRSMFYKLGSQGRAPRTHNVGTKVLISPQADAEWLRNIEAETASERYPVRAGAVAAT
jgi:predicted DNA-binding transcriptional regulator AlpA